MKYSTKKDLFTFLNSFEETIRTEYVSEYLNDVFLEYYQSFKMLSPYEREEVVDYLSTEYVDNSPDYALALGLLPSVRDDHRFDNFLSSLEDKHDRYTMYEDDYDKPIDENVLLFVSSITKELLSELEHNVTKRLLNLLGSIEFDYNIIFDDWSSLDYMFDGCPNFLIDSVYNLVNEFNNHDSDHYLYKDNESDLYFANMIKSIKPKLNKIDLDNFRDVDTNSLIRCFGLDPNIDEIINRDIVDKYSLSRSTDTNICIILIGVILECLQIDMDYDNCYEEHNMISAYDYVASTFAPLEYAINLDK